MPGEPAATVGPVASTTPGLSAIAPRRLRERLATGAFAPVAALCDLLLPEQCAACGACAGHGDWEEPGLCVAGLRPWDRPHLCRACAAGLFAQPCAGVLTEPSAGWRPGEDGGELPVWAAAPTSALLTGVVGAWKYHGVRGLAWPLARALAAAWSSAGGAASVGAATAGTAVAGTPAGAPVAAPGTVLVAVPLHASRRRARGFNQADLLADLAGPRLGLPVAKGALVRTRATAQQARLADARARSVNLEGAFAARPPEPGRRRVLLVDDLVTAGATARAAAAALRTAGWDVAGVLALGLAVSRGDGAAGGADPDA